MITTYDESMYKEDTQYAVNNYSLPIFYEWIGQGQIQEEPLSMGFTESVEWTAFLKDLPTENVNYYNEVPVIGFTNNSVKTYYIPLQYKFGHFRGDADLSDAIKRAGGDVNNNYMLYPRALMLAKEEVGKFITQWVLTGTATVSKDGKNQMVATSKMYGLLNYPQQVDKQTENNDQIDKWIKALKEGLIELKLGDVSKPEMLVIVSENINMMLTEPHTVNNAVTVSGEKWRDVLISTIQGKTNGNVVIEKSDLISNQMIILPRDPKLLKYAFSASMLPVADSYVDRGPSKIAWSYLNFTLGGIVAREKVILRVNKK